MSEGRKAVPLGISLDEASIAELDRVASARGDSRSSIMRAAIRKGLESLKAGEGAEPIVLDGELSADVGKVAEWQKWSRQKVLIESVRMGLSAVHTMFTMNNVEVGENVPAEAVERLKEVALHTHPDYWPLSRDLVRCRFFAEELQQRIEALRRNFPEVRAHFESIERLAELRQKLPPGSGPAHLWTISPDEVKRQIAELEDGRVLISPEEPASHLARRPARKPAK